MPGEKLKIANIGKKIKKVLDLYLYLELIYVYVKQRKIQKRNKRFKEVIKRL